MALEKAVNEFAGHCKILAATPRYAEAADLLSQAERVLIGSYEELLRKVQLMGQTVFKDALKADPLFWQACMEEWGQGPGYKSRVAARNQGWLGFNSRDEESWNGIEGFNCEEWQRGNCKRHRT